MSDWIEGLERLRVLRDAGHLDDDEYQVAKARLLEAQESVTPSSLTPNHHTVSGDSDVQPHIDDEMSHSEEDGARSPMGKLLGIGALVGIPLAGLLLWNGGLIEQVTPFGGIPSSMQSMCVGFKNGPMTARPFDVSLEEFVTFITSDQITTAEPGGANTRLSWDDVGDGIYTLNATTTDEVADSSGTTKWSFRLVEGRGELENCGPDTLAFERQVVNGSDSGGDGVQSFLMALAMTANFKHAADMSNKAPANRDQTTATTPQAMPIEETPSSFVSSAHPQSASFAMTGTWVPEGEYCSSGAPWVFETGGRFRQEGTSGTWEIGGDKLATNVGGEIAVGTVRLISDDDIIVYWSAKDIIPYRRCPADWNSEPWFPSQS